jgi:SM-20-related protein
LSAILKPANHGGNFFDDSLLAAIASDIEQQGYSIRHGALPTALSDALLAQQSALGEQHYSEAGIGRGDDYLQNHFVRTDQICWINGDSDAGQQWLHWAANLQSFLNRRLFLGLFSFESHFAHYTPGDYYKRHLDAFKGQANRVLSLVTYLNPNWQAGDGGELVLYRDEHDREGIKVAPLYGTVVVFLSEQFPHEVLPASRDRYSIAGWFRVNTSLHNKIDPPR